MLWFSLLLANGVHFGVCSGSTSVAECQPFGKELFI